ncbi:Ca2+-dependent phosphoinositide-specific phospholipase C [Asticcacaulis sp. AND118]|uniref:Ca2+-dependent phosphoinositide-specific phospholipase C n=1 Tax=Asticcacaulis sp. AND118 TaxID=2840468 RepID=UPI001CFF708D|nr:Ca2+-dependent phosphoinositide-specific phospholipase C [Asticcacaulis sp. AND118]UDF05427.1 phosphatidylinositol-specific phospholipase C1-like protein [Asticcacaulis sp. AND118]
MDRRYAWLVGMGLWAGTAMAESAGVRLNEVQFIGTHNSYHVAPDAALFRRMYETNYVESADWPAKRLVPALDYSHPPLEVQLDTGLRVFELDLHDDPEGGRFADPGFLKALSPEVTAKLAPVDPAGELRKPGMKVFHAADTDVRSRCLRFTRCLEIIRDWSAAHPEHLPVFVQIETKEGSKPPVADAYVPAPPAPFGPEAWGRLHTEIEAVFPPAQIVRPAEVQGGHASVNAAVRAGGWPALKSLRGRVIFLLLDDPGKQDAYAAFTAKDVAPLLFVSRTPDDPRTAWLIRPKPKARQIEALVKQGFLVYTRADAGGEDTDLNKEARRREAFTSGSQLISTDYPRPDPRSGPHEVRFPSGFARCNPVLKSPCDAKDVQESPKKRE